MTLLKPILYLFLAAGVSGSALRPSQVDAVFKKEMAPLQASVDAVITGTGARVINSPKATYLDDYGVIVVVEVMLEPPRNPFSGFNSSDATRAIINTRYKDLMAKLSDFVKDRVGKTESVGPTESLTVIAHILNSNPADVPNLPGQLVISIKKTGAAASVREL